MFGLSFPTITSLYFKQYFNFFLKYFKVVSGREFEVVVKQWFNSMLVLFSGIAIICLFSKEDLDNVIAKP